MTIADVHQQIHPTTYIKKELNEDEMERIQDRLSPATSSSISLSSSISGVALLSGPGDPSSHQFQQQFYQHHQHQQQQQSQHQQQQQHAQQQQQITGRLFMTSHGNLRGINDISSDLSELSRNNPNYHLPCPLCDAPLEPRVFRQHLDRHYPRDSPICPVIQCGRRFAHPNSVRNHMRIKHTLQWAKMKAMRSSGGPFSGIPDFK